MTTRHRITWKRRRQSISVSPVRTVWWPRPSRVWLGRLPVHRVHQTCQCPKMNICETHATECGCEARTAEARGPESRQQEVDSWAGRHRALSPPDRGPGSAVSSPSGVLGLWPALGLPYGIGAGHYIFVLWFLLMAAMRSRCEHYTYVLWFLLLSFFLA